MTATLAKPKKSVASLDAPGALTQPPATRANFKINLCAGWLHPLVVIEGVTDETEARAALHRMLDQAILHVERTR